MLRIAVFASGEGTNLQALLDACSSRRLAGEVSLVVSSREDAGALRRAERAGVKVLSVKPRDFSSPEACDAFLAAECQKADVDVVCLAGWMLKVTAPLLDAFPQRILNIHPALLPAFGGQGMFGRRVHEAVLAAGARVSGCTVHLIDAVYDHGPILLQAAVPVLPSDTPETLSARVRTQEHWLYPEALRLVAEGRVRFEERRAVILPSREESSPRIRRALLSVSDKAGLVELAKGLQELGVEIVSTSGTARALTAAGIEVRPLDAMTGFPEILDGRVKTLHPKIHGGILLRRSDPHQAAEARALGLEPIDLVVVNLYPFERVAAGASSPYSREVIENIDIGGVTLIRAAAKNFEDVAVLVSPDDYAAVLKELGASGCQINLDTRRRLALEAIRHTAGYDAMIARAWGAAEASPAAGERFPERLTVALEKSQDLRYGENPHQRAALYRPTGSPSSFEQLHGKELSYNNLLDAFGTWDAVSEFETPAAVVFKHVTPSGVGAAATVEAAFDKAWACDPVSAFGGIVAVNRPFTKALAEALGKRFLEVIVAPSFEPGALEVLRQKKSVRLVAMKGPPPPTTRLRSLGAEVLATEPDGIVFGDALKCATKRRPTPDEEAALRFAWRAAKHVRSNAIVLAGPDATVGIGAGQMSRVDAVRLAGEKYAEFLKSNPAPKALVLASDAFFPFRDGMDQAAALGATAVIQPGGSIRDAEVVAAADEHGLAMVLTGLRHFKH
ncbi:MAG: bifunctional phosphoribosylaminoimidazolecarboxamide formyltransferase/IMP cyclohydrolase [Elusimicrobia bacterium]|nr:bifunctional phosphoribosylaminoimidazolecarboxamide formyltransferase/IMP cyclohydrolase [Elusimicrobiota bacterium]